MVDLAEGSVVLEYSPRQRLCSIAMLDPEIHERITRDFEGADSEAAAALLIESGLVGRVARCVVVAARGDLGALRECIERAARDERDVIVEAETDDQGRRVRDLSSSFLLDAPETLWCVEAAKVMRRRGYRLVGIESRPVRAEQGRFAADEGEGVATFEGAVGAIRIEKRSGAWALRDAGRELARAGMDQRWRDEAAFLDAVSSYVLSEQRGLDRGASG